jgi:endonuclease/exonuclease/phosphatase family metal-dependent hydrolase
VVALGNGCPPSAECVDAGTRDITFTLLSANVGTSSLLCEDYVYKLCDREAEATIGARIAALAPDVIVLQEVLPEGFCDQILPETDERRACFPATDDGTSQISRLLPDGYRFACEPRNGYECVAVDFTRHELDSVVDSPPAPSGCDDGFTVGAYDVTLEGQRVNVVNAHPASGFEAACRADQLRQMFEGDQALAAPTPTIVAGDMNLDPFLDADESVAVWDAHVDDDERFHYHSGLAEHDPPYPTSVTVLGDKVLDHVVSDTLTGSCVTLGATADTATLDDGLGAMDHRALLCTLTLTIAEPCE